MSKSRKRNASKHRHTAFQRGTPAAIIATTKPPTAKPNLIGAARPAMAIPLTDRAEPLVCGLPLLIDQALLPLTVNPQQSRYPAKKMKRTRAVTATEGPELVPALVAPPDHHAEPALRPDAVAALPQVSLVKLTRRRSPAPLATADVPAAVTAPEIAPVSLVRLARQHRSVPRPAIRRVSLVKLARPCPRLRPAVSAATAPVIDTQPLPRSRAIAARGGRGPLAIIGYWLRSATRRLAAIVPTRPRAHVPVAPEDELVRLRRENAALRAQLASVAANR